MGDQDVQVVYISKPPVALPQAITEGDYDSILERLGDLEDGLDLGDLNDVDTTGAANGYALTYDSGDSTWKPTEIAGAVETVTDTTSIDLTLASGDLQAAVKYAGTGTADTAARSDHTHNATLVTLNAEAATGVLSSGTRNLRNAAGPTLVSGVVYDVTAEFEVRGRNNVNSGTVNLLCRVGADGSYPQRSRNVQTVGGVPSALIIRFHAVLTGAGSGVTEFFAVQFSSGDAIDLRDHELVVKYEPRR